MLHEVPKWNAWVALAVTILVANDMIEYFFTKKLFEFSAEINGAVDNRN